MRKLAKSVPPADLVPTPETNRSTEVREYTLITPLYGGGVEPFEYDPITVVRATEIRGLLRFWWRACRGCNATGDLTEMKEREAAIWGKAATKNDKGIPLENIVTISVEGNHKTVSREDNNDNLSDYASFPLRPTEKQKKEDPAFKEKHVYVHVSFKLTISFPGDIKTTEDIHAALWAWETFGGVGARTRRGFGALQRQVAKGETDLPLSDSQKDVKDWIHKNLDKYILEGIWPANTPHLSKRPVVYVTRSSGPPTLAWQGTVERLKHFRQTPAGRSGRSNWPEAETIRYLTNQRYDKYKLKNHPQKFPRAAFGLPIIFHFKDEKCGDPYDTTLQVADKKGGNETEKRDRFASPLILKPLMCHTKNAVGIALLLEGTHLPTGEIRLKGVDKDEKKDEKRPPVETQLLQDDLKQLSRLDIAEKNNDQKIDILQAFIHYLERGLI